MKTLKELARFFGSWAGIYACLAMTIGCGFLSAAFALAAGDAILSGFPADTLREDYPAIDMDLGTLLVMVVVMAFAAYGAMQAGQWFERLGKPRRSEA